MHRDRYLTRRLSILSPFPECEGRLHFWIATLTGYRVWADMPPKEWTKLGAADQQVFHDPLHPSAVVLRVLD